MVKVIVNGNVEQIRTLSPFAYKDIIKAYERADANVCKVALDGAKAVKHAVTSGRDVKSGSGAMKYHVYFQAVIGGEREWMPITKVEFDALKSDPAFVLDIERVVVPAEAAPAEAAPAEAAPAEQPVAAKGRKAKREVVEA